MAAESIPSACQCLDPWHGSYPATEKAGLLLEGQVEPILSADLLPSLLEVAEAGLSLASFYPTEGRSSTASNVGNRKL